MKFKAVLGIMLTLLLMGMFHINGVCETLEESASSFVDDVFIAPDVPRQNSSITPGYYETSEYMIGSVAVGVILLESNGSIDPSTEDWDSYGESRAISEIKDGVNWWAAQNPHAGVSFKYDIHYRVPTSYEPINHPKWKHYLWISEAMSFLGYFRPDPYYLFEVRDYVNALRTALSTDWAFAIFVVNNLNDPDELFPDGYSAYAYPGGPFFVLPYEYWFLGTARLDRVCSHEMGHVFYATDEYNGIKEYSGYLNASDDDFSECIMHNQWFYGRICSSTGQQVGWRDSDGDGIQDIVDTFPNTTLTPYEPDPTNNSVLTYFGSVTEVPYPNNNPHGTGNDVTINTITKVEYRVDYGPWMNATPTDGSFDEAQEDFTFTTPQLSPGKHTVETRGWNSVGNVETPYVRDEVTVEYTPVPPSPLVGGKAIPIDKPIIKPQLQIPWIWLSTIILPLIATAVFVKFKKKKQ